MIKLERDGDVAVATIDRPEALNALDSEMLNALCDIVTTKNSWRALILTGAGTKAFAAGADIKEMSVLSHEAIDSYIHLGQQCASLIEAAPYPIVAAVNGYAYGGGFEIALACDVIVTSDNAKFALPEIKLGLIPGFGGTYRLQRAVGFQAAKLMIFGGEPITASQALQWHIAMHVCPQEELLDTAKQLCRKWFSHSSDALAAAKKALVTAYGATTTDAMDNERALFSTLFATEAAQRALKSF